jgi:5-methylcytosine-specific restriction protein A
MRARVLREEPYCRECARIGRIGVIATHVDHINGRADRKEDYLPENLQALCTECHSEKTARESGFGKKRSAFYKGCDADGNPHDPHHHWKK